MTSEKTRPCVTSHDPPATPGSPSHQSRGTSWLAANNLPFTFLQEAKAFIVVHTSVKQTPWTWFTLSWTLFKGWTLSSILISIRNWERTRITLHRCQYTVTRSSPCATHLPCDLLLLRFKSSSQLYSPPSKPLLNATPFQLIYLLFCILRSIVLVLIIIGPPQGSLKSAKTLSQNPL